MGHSQKHEVDYQNSFSKVVAKTNSNVEHAWVPHNRLLSQGAYLPVWSTLIISNEKHDTNK